MGLTPSYGLLLPGGSFTCTVSCTTDMCGDYADILHVQVARLLSLHSTLQQSLRLLCYKQYESGVQSCICLV